MYLNNIIKKKYFSSFLTIGFDVYWNLWKMSRENINYLGDLRRNRSSTSQSAHAQYLKRIIKFKTELLIKYTGPLLYNLNIHYVMCVYVITIHKNVNS